MEVIVLLYIQTAADDINKLYDKEASFEKVKLWIASDICYYLCISYVSCYPFVHEKVLFARIPK